MTSRTSIQRSESLHGMEGAECPVNTNSWNTKQQTEEDVAQGYCRSTDSEDVAQGYCRSTDSEGIAEVYCKKELLSFTVMYNYTVA